MKGPTRRSLLASLGLAPWAGAALAWATEGGTRSAAPARLSPRERIQRHHLPNLELTTHEGVQVRFYDDLVKDRKVAINFMYVKCEGICVPTTSNLVRVQKMLNGRVGRDIFFYSITLKPEEDTPADLKRYAEMHGVGPGWLFLTGAPGDIEKLRRALGFTYDDPVEDADKSNHIGMVRLGVEPALRWAACPGMARPEQTLRTMLFEFDSPSLKGIPIYEGK
ncbi:MAG TPA: SCO family protein [Candidatus Xenobia bacterium]|nr:SCO family protein [Candidatus Xenobia bacterium]